VPPIHELRAHTYTAYIQNMFWFRTNLSQYYYYRQWRFWLNDYHHWLLNTYTNKSCEIIIYLKETKVLQFLEDNKNGIHSIVTQDKYQINNITSMYIVCISTTRELHYILSVACGGQHNNILNVYDRIVDTYVKIHFVITTKLLKTECRFM